uniref:Uncharacterized protein n=1 Tax=Alexandrium monilatum TaxID=311494 RepID=A0A7S4Q801_9DINO
MQCRGPVSLAPDAHHVAGSLWAGFAELHPRDWLALRSGPWRCARTAAPLSPCLDLRLRDALWRTRWAAISVFAVGSAGLLARQSPRLTLRAARGRCRAGPRAPVGPRSTPDSRQRGGPRPLERLGRLRRGNPAATWQWNQYCRDEGNGTYDARRHPESFVEEFLERHEQGLLPHVQLAKKGLLKRITDVLEASNVCRMSPGPAGLVSIRHAPGTGPPT